MVGLAAVVGALLGVIAVRLVVWLPQGIDERLEQPPWTRQATRPALLVALGTALGLVLGLLVPSGVDLALGLVLVAVLLPAVAIDIAWRIVPDTLVVTGVVGALVVLALGRPEALVDHLLAAAIAGGLALGVALVSRGGFGLGDVKLVAMFGIAIGPSLPLAIVIGFGVAVLVALPVLLLRGRRATVPLVPFLAVGALVAVTGQLAGYFVL
ncbi:MAG: prepilin peptidase [Thermoleophilia bacterium]|nr:prepilin peptidase [Thermoleophilia bacterium]